jgi:hypothetical protein
MLETTAKIASVEFAKGGIMSPKIQTSLLLKMTQVEKAKVVVVIAELNSMAMVQDFSSRHLRIFFSRGLFECGVAQKTLVLLSDCLWALVQLSIAADSCNEGCTAGCRDRDQSLGLLQSDK